MVKERRRRQVCIIVNGLVTRIIFVAHGALCMALLGQSKIFTSLFFLFLIPIAVLLLESVVTLCLRRGKEVKYVWPCGFFYIATIVPMIWVLHLDLLNSGQDRTEQNATMIAIVRKGDDIEGEKGKTLDQALLDALKASDIDARKCCEIGVIICLIIGSWLTPRSSMSREQVSALLLGYVANAADILELFESLESPKTVYQAPVTYGILVVYTLALLQFALVTTAKSGMKKKSPYDDLRNNVELNTVKLPNSKVLDDVEMNSEYEISKPKTYVIDSVISSTGQIISASVEQNVQSEDKQCCTYHSEYPQILVTLLMQDGPFLILRLVLSIKFKVVNELHIFFLCKNAVVCVLLVHRFLVLALDGDVIDSEYDAKTRGKPNCDVLDASYETPYGSNNYGIDNGISDSEKHEEFHNYSKVEYI